MAKKYLNAKEKSAALTLAAFISYMETLIEEWSAIGRPTNMIKYAKTAKTFTAKVLDFMFKDLEQGEKNKVLGELHKMHVVVKYTDQAVREYAEMTKLDGTTPVETQDLLDIVSLAAASCSVCEEPGDGCHYKELFLKYDMEPITTSPGPKGCPYRIGG